MYHCTVYVQPIAIVIMLATSTTLCQKIFYNRSTNSVAFCLILFKSFKPLPCNSNNKPPSLFMDLSQSRSEILANCEILIPLIVPLVWNLFFYAVAVREKSCKMLQKTIFIQLWCVSKFLQRANTQDKVE